MENIKFQEISMSYRRTKDDLDFVTKYSIIVMLRQRIRSLFGGYRIKQKEEGCLKPTSMSYIRKEIRKANRAIKILK